MAVRATHAGEIIKVRQESRAQPAVEGFTVGIEPTVHRESATTYRAVEGVMGDGEESRLPDEGCSP